MDCNSLSLPSRVFAAQAGSAKNSPAYGHEVEITAVKASRGGGPYGPLLTSAPLGCGAWVLDAGFGQRDQEIDIERYRTDRNRWLAGNLLRPSGEIEIAALELRFPEAPCGTMERRPGRLLQGGSRNSRQFMRRGDEAALRNPGNFHWGESQQRSGTLAHTRRRHSRMI